MILCSKCGKETNKTGYCKKCRKNYYRKYGRIDSNEISENKKLYGPLIKELENKKLDLLEKLKNIDLNLKEYRSKYNCITYKKELSRKVMDNENKRAKEYYYKNKEKVFFNTKMRLLAKRHNIYIKNMWKLIDRESMWRLHKITNCEYCNKKFEYKIKNKCIDHIIPIDEYNKPDINNFAICCKECNSKKSNKDLLRFAKEFNIELSQNIINKYNKVKFSR